jgi:cell cycle checkpoint control protein RAD9A
MLADALSTSLDIRFTENEKPVYVNVEAEDCTMLFVIATNHLREAVDVPRSQVRRMQPAHAGSRIALGVAAAAKRPSDTSGTPAPSRPRISTGNDANEPQHELDRSHRSQRTPGTAPAASFSAMLQDGMDSNMFADEDTSNDTACAPPPSQSQPLFLASQVSVADMEVIRQSGLGIESMDADEFAAMLEGDGEEIGEGISDGEHARRASTSEYDELEEEMGLTQRESFPQKVVSF